MKVRIRRIDGLYLHKNGGFTNKEDAVLISFPRAGKVIKRLAGRGIPVVIEFGEPKEQAER